MKSKACRYIELNIIKKPKNENTKKSAQNGICPKRQQKEVYKEVFRSKGLSMNRVLLAGIAMILIGVIISVALTSSSYYDYFYYYGLPLLGLIFCLFAFGKKVKLSRMSRPLRSTALAVDLT